MYSYHSFDGLYFIIPQNQIFKLPLIPPHLQTQLQDGSRLTFSWPFSYISFSSFNPHRCTLTDFTSVYSLASLLFLSCCHRTTTTGSKIVNNFSLVASQSNKLPLSGDPPIFLHIKSLMKQKNNKRNNATSCDIPNSLGSQTKWLQVTFGPHALPPLSTIFREKKKWLEYSEWENYEKRLGFYETCRKILLRTATFGVGMISGVQQNHTTKTVKRR